MSKATDRLRRHVASYKWTSLHRENCLEVCDEVDRLAAEVSLLRAVFDHAENMIIEPIPTVDGVSVCPWEGPLENAIHAYRDSPFFSWDDAPASTLQRKADG